MRYFRSAYNFKENECGKIKEILVKESGIEMFDLGWKISNDGPDYIMGKPLEIRFRIRHILEEESVYAAAA